LRRGPRKIGDSYRLQRFVAKRMGATIFQTDSSNVPMLSQPGLVLDVIRNATETRLAQGLALEGRKITSPSRGFEV
jgi:hypothetical protein